MSSSPAPAQDPLLKAYSDLFPNPPPSPSHLHSAIDSFRITRAQYAADCEAKTYGTANPTLMERPFWKAMVGPGGGMGWGLSAWTARGVWAETEDVYGDPEGAVWCFRRFGGSRTELADGRIVCIGGEHEDSYDPDFCIYNGKYPIDIFPPTDYHTSTYFADSTLGKEYIFIIGGLGYLGDASRDQTAVHRLDLSDFSMQRLETSGAGPSGATHGHKAELIGIDNQPVIKITRKEGERYVLRLRDLTWIQ